MFGRSLQSSSRCRCALPPFPSAPTAGAQSTGTRYMCIYFSNRNHYSVNVIMCIHNMLRPTIRVVASPCTLKLNLFFVHKDHCIIYVLIVITYPLHPSLSLPPSPGLSIPLSSRLHVSAVPGCREGREGGGGR